MTLGKTFSAFIWTIFGLVLISASPALFHDTHLTVYSFLTQILQLLKEAIQPGHILYVNPLSHVKRHLFPDFFTPYWYSLTLVFGTYLFSIILAIVLSTLLIFLKKWTIGLFKGVLFTFESLPDIFIILIMQYFLVWFYKRTGHHLVHFVQYGTNRIYVLPICVMAILPTIYLTKIMLVNLGNELTEPYINLAKSKGLNQAEVVYKHVLRNTLISTFYHSRSVLWMLLSNLLMVEYFFNLNGVTYFILYYYQPIVLLMGLLLMFVPLFVAQNGLQHLIEWYTGRKGEGLNVKDL